MRMAVANALAMSLTLVRPSAQTPDDTYRLGPDSERRAGVPQGKVFGPLTLSSQVFPNTTRNYWVYVPALYSPAHPACLMVFFDGHAYVGLKGDFRIPFVFDNLIYRREMPLTIGVFINPGHGPDQKEASAADWGDQTTNRRVEFNALDDKYSRLIVNELLPALSKEYNISTDPENRAVSGASSGAICAFTVAWHRPDQFRKVISTIGSFTNIMGGHVCPDLIRQSDPKPIRIFLQDGVNDHRGLRRDGSYDPTLDWHAQNIKMLEALREKNYDVNFTWGIGGHSCKQGGAIMPEMLRWLWRDYPRIDDPKDPSNRSLLAPVDAGNPAPERRAGGTHDDHGSNQVSGSRLDLDPSLSCRRCFRPAADGVARPRADCPRAGRREGLRGLAPPGHGPGRHRLQRLPQGGRRRACSAEPRADQELHELRRRDSEHQGTKLLFRPAGVGRPRPEGKRAL